MRGLWPRLVAAKGPALWRHGAGSQDNHDSVGSNQKNNIDMNQLVHVTPSRRTPSRRTYVALEHVQKFLAYGRSLGIPVNQLLDQYGVDLERDTNKTGYVPGHIWEVMIQMGMDWCARNGEDLPGLRAATDLGTGFMGLWSFIIEKSVTLEEAIATAGAYQKLHTDSVDAALRYGPGVIDLVIKPLFNSEHIRQQVADWYLATLVLFVQHCTDNVTKVIKSVHFRQPEPAHPQHRQRYQALFRCPVEFNQPDNFLRVYARARHCPLVTADPELKRSLTEYARSRLQAWDETRSNDLYPIEQQLRQLLHEGRASKDQLAADLDMSPRTLHRKLNDMGTSYQRLLHHIRLDEAKVCLMESALPMSTIAERLGFRDPQSFSRWFGDQAGEPPSKFRRRQA